MSSTDTCVPSWAAQTTAAATSTVRPMEVRSSAPRMGAAEHVARDDFGHGHAQEQEQRDAARDGERDAQVPAERFSDPAAVPNRVSVESLQLPRKRSMISATVTSPIRRDSCAW